MDTLIQGGTLVDGSGSPKRLADVWVKDGLIHAVEAPGSVDPAQASDCIDATGMLVTPGFVTRIPTTMDRRPGMTAFPLHRSMVLPRP